MSAPFHERFAVALRAELPAGFEITADEWSVRADYGTACLVGPPPAVADRRAAVTDADVRAWVARTSAALRRYLPHYTEEAKAAGAALLAAIETEGQTMMFASRSPEELTSHAAAELCERCEAEFQSEGLYSEDEHRDYHQPAPNNPVNPILARFRKWVEGETLADPTWLEEWLAAMDDTSLENDAAQVLDVLYTVPYRRREREAQEVHARRVLSRLLALSRAAARLRCDWCEEPATCFYPALAKPVQLCDGCEHDARRSGWVPGQN